jgi:hypothetical protein
MLDDMPFSVVEPVFLQSGESVNFKLLLVKEGWKFRPGRMREIKRLAEFHFLSEGVFDRRQRRHSRRGKASGRLQEKSTPAQGAANCFMTAWYAHDAFSRSCW